VQGGWIDDQVRLADLLLRNMAPLVLREDWLAQGQGEGGGKRVMRATLRSRLQAAKQGNWLQLAQELCDDIKQVQAKRGMGDQHQRADGKSKI